MPPIEAKRPSIEEILNQVRAGTLSVEEAHRLLAGYEELGFAKIDYDREARKGFAEVIFGQGKTTEQLVEIFARLAAGSRRLLATRVSEEGAAAVMRAVPDVHHNRAGRTLFWRREQERERIVSGYVAVVSAGTSDLPVAEEAAATVEAFGCEAKRVYDVGVAGIHRLFDRIELIRGATASVVIAGMEGALASVVAGLVARPVVAVPTSIGYGASFGGLAALLAMLNACAPGISVVNIDNGFGGGYIAASINRIWDEVSRGEPAGE